MCGFTDVIQIVYTMSVTSLTHGVLIWLRLAPTRTGINPPRPAPSDRSWGLGSNGTESALKA